jgi:hypothetical protein
MTSDVDPRSYLDAQRLEVHYMVDKPYNTIWSSVDTVHVPIICTRKVGHVWGTLPFYINVII